MNGDERQGDANLISDREKKNSSRGPRVQSRVHIMFPSPPLSLPEHGEPCARKKKKGRREEPTETQSDGRREKEPAGAIRAAPLFGDGAEHRAGEGRAEAPTALQPAGDDGGAARGRGEESPQRPVQWWISS